MHRRVSWRHIDAQAAALMRLIIVDPALADFQGHHAEDSLSTAEAAVAMGIETVVLGNQRWQAPSAVPVERVFAGSTYWPEAPEDWWRHLKTSLQGLSIGHEDHVFAHSISRSELAMLVHALESMELAQIPHIHILVHSGLETASPEELDFLWELFRTERPNRRWFERFHFWCTTPELRDEYNVIAGFSGTRFRWLPPPVPARSVALPGSSDGSLLIGTLGDARTEKGFHLLPCAIEELLEDPGRTRPVRFLLQSNFNVPEGEPLVVEAHERLRDLASRGVELVEGPFAPAEYARLLAAIDIVVLPYLWWRYQRRSSGILLQALVAGKVTVVPARTWMAMLVDDTRGVAFEGEENLGLALRAAVRDFDRLSEGAHRLAGHFREVHSPTRVVERLLAAATPASEHAVRRVLYAPKAPFPPAAGDLPFAAATLSSLSAEGVEVDVVLPENTGEPARREAHRFLAAYPFVRHVFTSHVPGDDERVVHESETPLPFAPVSFADLGGIRHMADLVLACGGTSSARNLEKSESIDLLWIGSETELEFVRGFYEATFRATLMPGGVVWVIASRDDLDFELDGGIVIRRVTDLRPLLAATRAILWLTPSKQVSEAAWAAEGSGKPIVGPEDVAKRLAKPDFGGPVLSRSLTAFHRLVRALADGDLPPAPELDATLAAITADPEPFGEAFRGFWLERSSPLARRLLGEGYFRRRRFLEAKSLGELVDALGNAALCHRRLEAALREKVDGRLDLAVGAYVDALHAFVRSTEAWSGLGETLERLGQKEQAASAYAQAASLKR